MYQLRNRVPKERDIDWLDEVLREASGGVCSRSESIPYSLSAIPLN
jgi:hypothetical protein